MAPLRANASSELFEGGYCSVADGEGLGIARVLKWAPTFLTYSEVKPEELEGYKCWKSSSDGGIFA